MNEKLISDIENIRNQTNIRTVEFLRLLTELNPKQSKRLLNEIQLLDSKVIELSELLHMSTKRTKLEILNEIEQVRAKNNTYWMDVVRMCFELDEKRAQSIFNNIKECDKQIRDLSKEITDEKD
tara:strand:- start:631 stop:1002 length:372 start_codon:yes stop_codon:yes gene_type:complete